MIEEFVKVWDARKSEIEAKFRASHPSDYEEIVKAVVTILNKYSERYIKPDSTRITSIDHDHYQGIILFVIASSGNEPDFWYVKVYYGSCSLCDTLQGIRDDNSDPPTDSQVADYMTLALHILQGIKFINA